MDENIDDNLKRNDNDLKAIDEPGYIERIDKRTLKPLNDPNCTHEWVDDNEVIGRMRAQTCLHCPLGRWVPYNG